MSDDDSHAVVRGRATWLWTTWIVVVLGCAAWPLVSRLLSRWA